MSAMATGPADHCRPEQVVSQSPRTERGYASGKADYLLRLRKVEGQVRGVQKMVEADAWCPDVVVQIGSLTRALQEVAVGLLRDHVQHCVADGEASVDEVAGAIRQVLRL